MNVILFDYPATKQNLLPFTFLRPVAGIRIGILTIREKWELMFPANYSYLTEPYLSTKYKSTNTNQDLYVNGSVLPTTELVLAIDNLGEKELLTQGDVPIAFYGSISSVEELTMPTFKQGYSVRELASYVVNLEYVYDIFINNEKAIRADFELITKGRKSRPINDPHTVIYKSDQVFVEENATIKAAILDAGKGPIYIGAGATIGPGSIVQGNTSICEGAVLNLGTKIRGDSTIGPYCKVGGEISNSVMFAYSSKYHDGYLGNSVIAEWCNIGAGTSASNLKNNYGDIKIWNYHEIQFKDTGRQFCGLMMGDHSKCGINTMFNTGTVVGICSNIFGSGFPNAFIPSFSWGGAQGFSEYRLDKAIEMIRKVYARREKILDNEELEILRHIFDLTQNNRKK